MSSLSTRIDLTGQRFGKWTVLRYSHYQKYTYWLCRCECGTENVIPGNRLRRKASTQCRDCAQKAKQPKATEAAARTGASALNVKKARLRSFAVGAYKQNIRKAIATNTVHGHARDSGHSPTYTSWKAMKRRCLDSKHKAYPNYGGRGIKVCDRWVNSFEDFLADMGERPPRTTIDRIDNDLGYFLGNCRWSTPSQQRKNQRKRTTKKKR